MFLTVIFLILGLSACSQNNNKQSLNIKTDTMYYNNLSKKEKSVIINKGTEISSSGKYYKFDKKGTYLCKQCNNPLYKSTDKFDAQCGWPSFDDEIPGAITRQKDDDGLRTEIICSNCGAHLGHVFEGEGFTPKNTRHCVNSISLNFVPVELKKPQKLQRAIFAGGCFWGVEFYLQKQNGVIITNAGFTGGTTINPTYDEVCSGQTGHAEAVEVYFNPEIVSYEKLTKLFLEIHDPTQKDRQGPDVGNQYRSEIFYMNDYQKKIAQKLINQLINDGYNVVTKLSPATEFFYAEDYHQDYYNHKGTRPYCHIRTQRFK